MMSGCDRMELPVAKVAWIGMAAVMLAWALIAFDGAPNWHGEIVLGSAMLGKKAVKESV